MRELSILMMIVTIMDHCGQQWPYVTTWKRDKTAKLDCYSMNPHMWYTVTGCDHGCIWLDVANVTSQCDQMWPTWPFVTNVTRCYKCYNTKMSLTIRPHVVTCDHVICDQMLPCVTEPIWTICDHMQPPVTRWYQIWWLHLIPHQLLWLPTPVTLVTHSSYSGYSVQLLQLPISVIPVTHSSYSGYPLQLL